MENIKSRLQELMYIQREKNELYIQTVQEANRLKAESYSLQLKVSECREELMAG